MLANCIEEGMSEPEWSSEGIAFMLLVLGVMLMILEYLHMRGRSCRQCVTQEEDVMQLIEAVGFKVSKGGACVVLLREEAHLPNKAPGGGGVVRGVGVGSRWGREMGCEAI